MEEKRAQQLLERAQGLLSGHFVFNSGVHCGTYINKDAVFAHARITDDFARALALAFDKDGVEVVAAPEKGAIILGQSVARWLEFWRTRNDQAEVLSVYAEKVDGGFIFKRGYDKLLPGKRVVVIEDQLTTGGSAKRTIEAVRHHGGTVVGVGAINNHGTSAEALGVPKLVTLLNIKQKTFRPHECPLCSQGVPVDTHIGHGKEFLANNVATPA